jgi:hypothetical protein
LQLPAVRREQARRIEYLQQVRRQEEEGNQVSDPRINKRWRRSLRPRPTASVASAEPGGACASRDDGKWRVVYRPKTKEEGFRRYDRAAALQGTPFVRMPGGLADSHVLFEIEGHEVKVSDVEMVFNDCLFADAVSNYGEDGPLYKDTLEGPMVELYKYALKAYAGVELPAVYRMPQ